MFEWRVIYAALFDGWWVQKRKVGSRYWYPPQEEVTYGVLDSETYRQYPTESAARRRMNKLRSASSPTTPPAKREAGMSETESRAGKRASWEWNSQRKCWESRHMRIYPFDGGFIVSSYGCWLDGFFSTFDAAEAEAFSDDATSQEGDE